MGIARASAEDLLRAAQFQLKYKIDLTSDLEFFCKQSEVFKPPIDTDGQGGGFTRENQEMVQSRVSFDQGTDQAQDDDAFCTDGQKWYIYSD